MAEDYDDAPSSGSVSAFTAANARLERVELRAGSYEWDETYWGVNVREGANAYWVTLIFDAELLVTGSVRCDGVEVSVEVPLRQTDVKMDFALQVPLEYVDLSDEVVALTAKRMRLDGSGAIRPRLSAAKREVSSKDPFLLLGNTNKSNEARRWWAAHEEVRVKMEVVREMLRDAPRLCAERLPIDKAEGGAANVQNETWVQEGAASTPTRRTSRTRACSSAPTTMSSSCRRQAPRRLAALRHRRRRSPRRRLAAHLARGAAPPLRRPLRRRRAGGGGGLAGHAVARRTRRVGRVAQRLDAELTARAGSPSACAGTPTTTRRAASRRRVPTSDSSSAPARAGTAVPATSSPASAAASPARCCRRRNCRAGGSSSSTSPRRRHDRRAPRRLFDCAAFAEAQRKVCVCSTETPAVTASARAVAANGAEPLGCVSEAVGSETDPIAGNRINDERNVQRRLESLGFDAGAGTSDPGHSRRLLLCAAAGIDDFEQPCDVGVTPCAVNTAECPAHRVSNRDTCLVDHPCALARIDPDEALPADHFSELVSTATLPEERRRLRETPTATPEEVAEIRRRLIVNGLDQDDMQNGMGHVARIMMKKGELTVPALARSSRGASCSRRLTASIPESAMKWSLPLPRARQSSRALASKSARVPGEYNHRGCVARPPLRRHG